MGNKRKKLKLLVLFMFLMLVTAGATIHTTTEQVQAASSRKKGFVVKGGKTYYYKKGKKVTGWQTIRNNRYYFNKKGVMKKGWLKQNGKYYFFDRTTGKMYTGWAKDSKGRYRYFGKKTGEMAVGWQKSRGKKRYFAKSNGYMYAGLQTIKGKKYFFDESTGVLQKEWSIDSTGAYRYSNKKTGVVYTKWVKNKKKNQTRYFDDTTGVMYTGFHRIGGKMYYFYLSNGLMATGWVKDTASGNQYYFNSKGVMATGATTIDGVTYNFASDGVYIPPNESSSGPNTAQPTGTRTIRNYLAGALQPVGQALYVWGGGWNDANRKGVSPTWKQWYDSQNSSYNYNNYRDLSTANRAKGLDCSGFVGWASYQVMHNSSGQGSGYTVVSGDIGRYYEKTLGWGDILNQNYLSKTNYKFYPGDIGYNDGHTWIVLGQCADSSLVIVHSTPQAGCQISGTPTASGSYSSQAVTLAKKYMSRYSGYSKYSYNTSSGNYMKNGKYLRWNRQTLADPDGFLNMTADQILYNLFGF